MFEKYFWLISVPVAYYLGWLKITTYVSVLSAYALYQTASANAEAIKAKQAAEGE